MPRRPPSQWLLIGLVAGLFAVVVVRWALALVVGSFKLLAVVGGIALLWVFLRGPRDGRS